MEQPLVASTSKPTPRPRMISHSSRCHGRPRYFFHSAPLSNVRSTAVCRSAVVKAIESSERTVVAERFPPIEAGAFLPDLRSFREEHRIRGYEVSPDQRATIVTIANLLQEVGGNHTVGLWGRTDEGFASLPDMKGILFVMTRLQLRVFEYPKWGDVVALETYFTEEGRLAYRRDWKITDPRTGKLLAAGTSTWVTINNATRRLAKVPDGLRERFLQFGKSSTTYIIKPEETRAKLPDMAMPAQVQGPKQVARRSDMDMNGHINNVTYVAWTLESVPEEVYRDYEVEQIEMDFKAECKAGDTVEAHCNTLVPPAADDDVNGNGNGTHTVNDGSSRPQLLHMLQKCSGGVCTELVRARTIWRPVPIRK